MTNSINKFPRIIDMGGQLVKLEPTTANAGRLLSAMNENREFLGEFLEWVDAYITVDFGSFIIYNKICESDGNWVLGCRRPITSGAKYFYGASLIRQRSCGFASLFVPG